MCGDFAAFDFHTPSAAVLGAALRGDEVVQVCQSCKQPLLAPVGVIACLHRKAMERDSTRRSCIPRGRFCLPWVHPEAVGQAT
jgi:hypothetical protein